MNNLPLNIDWQQILLHLFNFAILAGGLYLLLYKPVKDFIKKREEHYKSVDEDAYKEKMEALEIKNKYKEKMEAFEKEIDQMRDEAEKEIEEYHAQQLKYAHEEAENILQKARQNAEREHEQMIKAYTDEVKDMAVTAAERAMLKSQGDPFKEFLSLAERSLHSGQTNRE